MCVHIDCVKSSVRLVKPRLRSHCQTHFAAFVYLICRYQLMLTAASLGETNCSNNFDTLMKSGVVEVAESKSVPRLQPFSSLGWLLVTTAVEFTTYCTDAQTTYRYNNPLRAWFRNQRFYTYLKSKQNRHAVHLDLLSVLETHFCLLQWIHPAGWPRQNQSKALKAVRKSPSL